MPDEIRPTFTLEDAPKARPRPKHDAGGSTPPPRSGSSRARNTAQSQSALAADVRAAMNTLESLYTMIGAGLELFGAPAAAQEWGLRSNGLKATNEAALTASPRLARTIAGAGSTSGGAQLFITHVVAITPVVVIARAEVEQRRGAAAGRHAEEEYEEPMTFAERVAQDSAARGAPRDENVTNIRKPAPPDPTFIPNYRA